MSVASNHQGVTGVAIASLVLGIVTLLMFWLPVLHLLPGLLAVVLGIIGLRIARRRAVGGAGLAVAGILSGMLGMMPTALLVLALVGIGVAGGDIEIPFGERAAMVSFDEASVGE